MWHRNKGREIELVVYAKPNAKKSALVQITESAMHIALHAKAQDGEANEELVRFLAKLLSVPKSDVKLLRGKTGRNKLVVVPAAKSVLDFIRTYEKPQSLR